jgi:hypothetical protein
MGRPQELRRPFALGSGWRRMAKVALGHVAAAVRPRRARAITQGNLGGPLSPVDRLVVAALIDRALRRGESLERYAHLHRLMWQADAATAYHASVEDYFTACFLPNQAVIIDELERDLALQPMGRFHSLCEIGTGCGAALDHLSHRLTAHGVSRFVGLDLSTAQVALNTARFPACRFVAADACEWIPAHAGPGWILFCCGGVLEYLPERMLATLFASTGRHTAIRWVIVEPIDQGYDLGRETASRPFGWEQTWSHHYPHLLQQAGLPVRYSRTMSVGDVRWMLVLAGV